MNVLITRANPAAKQTAKTLEKRGHEAILLPLFEVIDTENQVPDTEFEGYIFTSKNSVDVLQNRRWKPTNKTAPAFCVGEKTEKAAKNLGFRRTHCAKGGGASLAKLLGEMNLSGKKLLYFSTPQRSFDMELALKSLEIEVKTIDVYEVKRIYPAKTVLKDAVESASNAYIFVYSALSGKHLADILETIKPTDILKTCTLIGISEQAVKSLEHIEWKEILVAKTPDEAEMISLMK